MAAKVVSFINLKGGVGKSTLSMMVSEYLYFRFGKRVLAIDMDSQANLTNAMVSADHISRLNHGSKTIYHLFLAALTGGAKLPDVIAQPNMIVSNISRGLMPERAALDMVISVPDLAQLDENMLEMWDDGKPAPRRLRYVLKDALESVVSQYDIIIIDCPPGLSVLTSNAFFASDYYVSPLIPEPFSRLGIDLVQDRVRELGRRSGLNVRFAGSILNKVMYYRNSHSIETPKLYGVQMGGVASMPRAQYNPFEYWIPDSETMRKLGDFENEDFGTSKFPSINNKYASARLRNRPGHFLSRDDVEGPTYFLYDRLERVVREFAERVELTLTD